MAALRTREESIAFLLSYGVTEEEIAQLAAADAAAQARSQVRAQQHRQHPPAPPKQRRKRALPVAPLAPPTPPPPAVPYVPPGPCTTKARYRLTNWKAYNDALVQRGSLTIWLADDVLAGWAHPEHDGTRARPKVYTDVAMQCILTLQQVYHLRLRQTEGLVRSLMRLAQVDLPVPDYSTLCRRRKPLPITLPRLARDEGLHVVVDSTGLKIFGEGEWKARQHGVSKRRTWRKLHLGVDEATHEVVACVLTTNDIQDGEVLEELLAQVAGPIDQVSADGAYDTEGCYHAITDRQARPVIPPRENAAINEGPQWATRNATIERVREIGRAAWKVERDYHRRSLAETAMFRMKSTFGAGLTSRSIKGQTTEALIRCAALNRMTQLGMPDSVLLSAA